MIERSLAVASRGTTVWKTGTNHHSSNRAEYLAHSVGAVARVFRVVHALGKVLRHGSEIPWPD